MKKLLTLALIAISSTALAGFDNNHKGGFAGGYAGTTMTVTQALKASDDTIVSLTGQIASQIDDDEFYFKDATGQIKIEVDDHAWNGFTITPDDRIIIQGKVDQEVFKPAEIEVFNVRKAD
ncbi:YgiW/YdeI family stress tolerance OB fold protein [Lonepinella sp. BR2357]|uniref:YgiW/YdeI family stress tolerance OB fold protein n=1 Tax=Lonepinella sp. BR2357 TaxID=3434549 RepID=UPI003F6E403E